MTQRTQLRRNKWTIKVYRKTKEGVTESSHARLAHTSKEMSENILELERLRRIFYSDYEKPMKKKILNIVRR